MSWNDFEDKEPEAFDSNGEEVQAFVLLEL